LATEIRSAFDGLRGVVILRWQDQASYTPLLLLRVVIEGTIAQGEERMLINVENAHGIPQQEGFEVVPRILEAP
jgi:hypothetical protein